MDFEKAKNISIVAFIILNAFLLFINFYTPRPGLSEERINSVIYVLNRNGIKVSESFDFINLGYKRQLELSHSNLDVHTTRPIFFINNQNVYNFENVFYNENERITFLEAGLLYENFGENFPIYTEEEARELIKNILNSLNKNMEPDFKRDIENGFEIAYRHIYNGITLYHNHIIVTVIDNNLSKIEFGFINPISFFGPNRTVRDIDEALLSFMRSYEADEIKSINIVYYLLSYEVATPFFRIIYTYNNFERSALISAY